MKVLILIFVFYFSVGATIRTIVAATIDTTGWRITLKVLNIDTGGTFRFKLGGNNETDTAALRLTVTSKGFSSATLGTAERMSYGSGYMRKAYPDNAKKDWDVSGDTALIKVRLTNLIFDSCSAVMDTDLGLYVDGTDTTGAVNDLAVTNESKQAYSILMPAAKWGDIDRVMIANDTIKLACLAHHAFGISAVRFTISDQHSHSVTFVVDSEQIYTARGEPRPPGEFYHTFNVSTLTDMDSAICSFKVFPRVGDSAAILSSDNTAIGARDFSLHDAVYHIDRSNTYGIAYAVVDSATGNDATCAAYGTIEEASAHPCSTCAKGLSVAKTYNFTTLSRAGNNADNAKIYIKKGSYPLMGNSTAVTDTGLRRSWATFRPYPGVSRDSVVLFCNGGGATNRITRYRYCKFSNLTLDLHDDGSTNLFQGLSNTTDFLWVDSCIVNGDPASVAGTTSTLAYYYYKAYITNSVLNDHWNMSANWARNDSFINVNSCGQLNASIGCYFSHRNNATGGFFYETVDTNKNQFNVLICNNEVYNGHAQLITMVEGPKRNIAFVNNVMEISNDSIDVVIGNILSDNYHECYNIILHHNTFVGQRLLIGYTEVADCKYDFMSIKGNVFYYWANKTDIVFTDPHGVVGWPITFGVNCQGNCNTSAASFPPEFGGTDYKWFTSYTPSPYGFIADSSNTTGSSGGYGNYRLTGVSGLRGIISGIAEKFDIVGKRRTSPSDIGAYKLINRWSVIQRVY